MTERPVSRVVASLRESFSSGLTNPLPWRKEQLRAVRRLLSDGEDQLLEAVLTDLGKSAVEARMTELSVVAAEIDLALHQLDRWASPTRASVPLVQQPARAYVRHEPLGVALVIAPWNYPIQLLLLPMVSAIAAGNCVIGKPSEVTPSTSAALADLVARHLDPRATAVVEGGAEETQELLSERFDTIFYTGGARVARIVAQRAAQHLTPLTLELGGKSPAIVLSDADIEVAAKRIAWGKFLNAGQTCVAPDYVLVDQEIEDRFVHALVRSTRQFYGDHPDSSGDYARIVNTQHFDRLATLLSHTAARVAAGGGVDRSALFIEPTVLTGVAPHDPVMDDELFGPILPVLSVQGIDGAIEFVQRRPDPLALYVFTRSDSSAKRVIDGTRSGGVGVNCTVQHVAVPDLPFGGIGPSGTGAYHGHHGFETFSHRRSVLLKPNRPDLPLQYPPYSKPKAWALRKLL